MTKSAPRPGLGAAIAATLLIFLVTVGTIMMPIATSAIVNDLNANVGLIQAAISIMSLIAASLYITGGKLGDIYGKKKLFIVGVFLYGIGTLITAIAPSATLLLIGWSLIRPIGMALTIPTSVGLLIATYPEETRRA